MHAAIKLELSFPSSGQFLTYCFQKDYMNHSHMHTKNIL